MDPMWLTLGVVAAVLVAVQLLQRLGQVSSAQARQLVTDGAALVDVRTAAEFSSGHLPGAVNVPVQALGGALSTLGARERPVVVYCASGARSALAASTLRRAGFQRVYNLGGMHRW